MRRRSGGFFLDLSGWTRSTAFFWLTWRVTTLELWKYKTVRGEDFINEEMEGIATFYDHSKTPCKYSVISR